MKKSRDHITQKDMDAFVSSMADFTFEMQVLRRFNDLKYTCDHGGRYVDPQTDKVRQFDIRATRPDVVHLAVAAECTNVGANAPILVHAVPRTDREAFHTVIAYTDHYQGAHAVAITMQESHYPPASPVGKRVDQVSKTEKGELLGGDPDLFDKVSQSINSAQALVVDVAHSTACPMMHAVVPLLVVPNERLWQVIYSADGTQQCAPARVDAATLFYDHAWTVSLPGARAVTYRFSHVEITTLGALETTLDRLWHSTTDLPGLFALAPKYGMPYAGA